MASMIPEGAEELETVYSNCDHQLEADIAKQLEERSGQTFSQHAGWNFCGYIWHKDGKWHNETWCYGSPRHVFTGDKIEDVIEQACDQHGRD